MYKSIIFDVDGVLIDSEEIMLSCLHDAVLTGTGVDASRDVVAAAFGLSVASAVKRLAPGKDPQLAIEKFDEYWNREKERAEIFDGVLELLAELKKRDIITGIVTSRDRMQITTDKQLMRAMSYIDHSVGSDETPRGKPFADPLLKALELAGAEAQGCLYIGDTYHDYQTAKNAGASYALPLWGGQLTKGMEPDIILNHPMDLLKYI